MSNVGRRFASTQSVDRCHVCWGMSLVTRHHRWLDRCSVVAKVALVARAISLASGGLFSNDHSRVDLPLAGAGGLLVVNINQRPSREASLSPVFLKPQHTLRAVSATATAMR